MTDQDDPSYDIFWEHGALVSLTASRWGARKKLTLEELGIEFDDDEEEKRFLELFRPGSKMLLDPELMRPFSALEQRARAALDKLGLEFPVLRGVRFVTNKNFVVVKPILDDLAQQYDDLTEVFVSDYQENRDTWLKKYSEYAKDFLKGKIDVADFMERVTSWYPSPTKIAAKFGMDYKVFTIASPKAEEIDSAEHHADIEAKLAIQEHWQAQVKEQITEFMEDAGKQLANEFTEAVGNVVDVLTDGKKKFTQRSLNALQKKMDALKGKNFMGYANLDEQIAKAEEAINAHEMGDYKDNDALKIGLKKQLSAVKNTLSETLEEDVGQMVKNFGALGKRKIHKSEETKAKEKPKNGKKKKSNGKKSNDKKKPDEGKE